MRGLSVIVSGEKIDDIERQSIVKAAYNLSFKNKYWSTSVANIRYMMVFIRNPEKVIGEDIPMHPKFLFSNDRVEQILCAFGHQAPTFMITNAAKCVLTSKEPPKNFHVRTATVETAVLDMKYIMENGYITNNNQNLSSKHRDTPLRGDDKMKIWDAMRGLYNRGSVVDITANSHVLGSGPGKSASDGLW
jgi:hypothetical protein